MLERRGRSPAMSYQVDHDDILAFRLCNREACICSTVAAHHRARTTADTRIHPFTRRRPLHSSKLTGCCATTAGTCCLASVLCASHLGDASCHRQPANVSVDILIWECPSCKSEFPLGPAVAQSCEDYPARLNLSERASASRGTATRFSARQILCVQHRCANLSSRTSALNSPLFGRHR